MSTDANKDGAAARHGFREFDRRSFLKYAGAAALAGATLKKWPAVAGPFTGADFERLIPADKKLDPAWVKSLFERGQPTTYRGAELEKIGMPVGGLCTGQLYLGGDGRLWHWDIFNLPQEPPFVSTAGPNYANPPKPASPIDQGFALKVTVGGKAHVRTLDSQGFNREHIAFRGQYPIGFIEYRDPSLPVMVSLEAFSPFIPLNVPDSSLPATLLRYTVKNTGAEPVEIELAGWLENAVCLGSGRPGRGQRRNRVLREAGLTMTHSTAEPLAEPERPAARPPVVFETFEHGYGQWEAAGKALGTEPASGALEGQQPVSGFAGKKLVNTFLGGDGPTGKLTSPPFKIERRYIAFLIGGGKHAGRACMNLLVDGKVVRTATGNNEERLDWREWDVSEFAGRLAKLEIVDNASEPWGHINVDQIVFTDDPMSARGPLEAQEDFGSMGLAILGEAGGVFAVARLPSEPAEVLFAAGADAVESEAVSPFGRKLTGAVGRKIRLAPGAEGEAVFVVAWYFPGLLRKAIGALQDIEKLRRHYAKRFTSAAAVARYVAANFERLAGQTRLWNRTWFDSTLPFWFLERTFIPVCMLATSACFQFDNGRFYAFEGVYCCRGTCQHVWNYAHSVARLFPELERDLRERTDFGAAWHEDGATDYRGECGRSVAHDGQCGIILRAWREHQMSPDDRFLRAKWPQIRRSVEYLINCDADENGLLEGRQYNTLDAAWFGPMAWISSFYLAALRAAEAMALEMSDQEFAARCARIAARGSEELVKQLYNGEYFIHRPDPKNPKATNTNDGCHIDQLMGQAWALQVGLPRITPVPQTLSALRAIWKYNFTPDVGPFREKTPIKGGRWYAMAGEGGVVMTTFPRGGAESATGQGGFAHYFNEVWTGQEHQLAAHMIWEGLVEEALVITRILHDRHHAARRNPFNEVECSDHYARAMASHGSFLAACGYEHHGPKGHLGFAPRISPENFRAPFTAAEGWGTFAQRRDGGVQTEILAMAWGRLRLRTLAFAKPANQPLRAVKITFRGKDVGAVLGVRNHRVLITLDQELILEAGERLEITLG